MIDALAALVGVVLAVLAAFFFGRRDASRSKELEEAKRDVRTGKEAADIDAEVRRVSDGELAERLRRWRRD